MKRTTYTSFLLSAAIISLLVSCSKDFLNVTPPSATLDSYFNSEKNVQLLLIGAYSELTMDETNYFPYWLGDILCHDSYKGGEGPGDQSFIVPLQLFEYSSGNPGLAEPYTRYYTAINRCNTIIDNTKLMADSLISPGDKAEITAEAQFIRGYFYFELIKMFGSVPLVLHQLPSSLTNEPLNSTAELWNQVENDFDSAAMVLPVKSAQSDVGRATKGAALGFLCKAYIYEQKWQQALNMADTIIASGQYQLEPVYANNWLLSHKNGVESVFEIQFANSGTGQYGNLNSGNTFSVFEETRSDGTGYGFDCPTDTFVSNFEPGDVRLKATVIHDGDTLWPGTQDQTIADNHTGFSTCLDGYTVKKFQLPPSERPTDDPSDAPNDWICIRYAEVLLWRAEAAAHVGGDWQDYVNMVRNRAALPNTTNSDALSAIYHERVVELGMEGQHFWDIIWRNQGDALLGKYGYTEANNRFYPLPNVQNFPSSSSK